MIHRHGGAVIQSVIGQKVRIQATKLDQMFRELSDAVYNPEVLLQGIRVIIVRIRNSIIAWFITMTKREVGRLFSVAFLNR